MGNQNVTNVSARVAARVPLDLAEWVAAQPYSQSELVVRALRALRDGPPAGAVLDGHLVPERQARVSELETALAGQKVLTEKWRKAAQAVMPMADRKPERGSSKLVADVLPVAGDQFPEQLTWWQKQQLANAGKAKKAG